MKKYALNLNLRSDETADPSLLDSPVQSKTGLLSLRLQRDSSPISTVSYSFQETSRAQLSRANLNVSAPVRILIYIREAPNGTKPDMYT